MPGGGYDQECDFFYVHWQLNKPKGGQDPTPKDAHIVRLHIESPRHDDDPGLNDLKRDVIQALLNSNVEVEQVVRANGYEYQLGWRTGS